MDIQAASRLLWNAYDNIATKVKQFREAIADESGEPQTDLYVPFRATSSASETSTNGQHPGFEAWGGSTALNDSPYSSRAHDYGHLTDGDGGSQRSQQGSSQHSEKKEDEDPPPLLVPPQPFPVGNYMPDLAEESCVLRQEDFSALAATVPVRHRWRRWRLLYSTGRDGISLATLYRRATEVGPCILAIRDRNQYVFGCFTAESWRVAPRYYGTGESFVFQLQPKPGFWRWHQRRMAVARNDFFQFGRPDCLALGGKPHYALFLDGDLLNGTSGESETFGSPCLASAEEFEIGRLELWGLA
eukprot:jgi/Botrbrau1/3088/Bobra.0070s0074.1